MMDRTKRPQDLGHWLFDWIIFTAQTSRVTGRQRIYRKSVANIKEEIALPYTAYGMYFSEENLAISTKALTMSVFFDQVI